MQRAALLLRLRHRVQSEIATPRERAARGQCHIASPVNPNPIRRETYLRSIEKPR